MIVINISLLFISGLILSFIPIALYKRLTITKKIKEFSHYNYKFIHPSKETLNKTANDISQDLKETALNYNESSIEKIILIHGTFVGDDPLLLNRAIAKRTPTFLLPFHVLYRKILKKIFNFINKDSGNFTEVHKGLLEKEFKQQVSLFNWSGSNNHFGRLCGVVELINSLYKDPHQNYLIIAHSHGGQILALMTQFFSDESIVDTLLKEELITQETIKQIQKIRTFQFRLVTMGTPVRYKWNLDSNVKILHFTNHRGKIPVGGNLLGGFWNFRGDYVQQFGGSGSDYFSLFDINNKKNEILDLIFIEEISDFFSLRKRRQRLHPQGLNLLIDYQDVKLYPNFYKTIFGHGIYTHYNLLSFHLDKILEEFSDN